MIQVSLKLIIRRPQGFVNSGAGISDLSSIDFCLSTILHGRRLSVYRTELSGMKDATSTDRRLSKAPWRLWAKDALLSFDDLFLCFFLKVRDLGHHIFFAHIKA